MEHPRKVLITNGGYAEIPLIRAGKAEGFHTCVAGRNEGAPGNVLADEYFNVDYSDADALEALVRSEKIDCICSGCSDYAYKAAGKVCNRLGLPGHDSDDVIAMIHDKDKFRQLAVAAGIPSPRAVMCSSMEDVAQAACLRFPVLVKPVDACGGHGISRCNNRGELLDAAQTAFGGARAGRIVLEEYLEGTDHGFTTLIKDRKVVFSFCDNEYHAAETYAVSAVSYPSDVSQAAINDLTEQVETLAGRLNLKDGLVHIQFKWLADGTPVIVEMCRRSPGDLYIEFVKHVTGLDYPRSILRAEMGLDFGHVPSRGPDGHCHVRQVVICRKGGTLQNISFSQRLRPYIEKTFVYFKKGQKAAEFGKFGVLFLKFPHKEALDSVMGNIFDEIVFDIQ
jgi:biotin carboxylase